MRRRTFTLLTVLLSVPFFSPVAARAQQTDTELLSAILCELRELRSAIHQGQVVTPLIEANVRERVQVRERISELEEKRNGMDQLVQQSIAGQAKLRERLRNLSRSGRTDLSEETAEQLERNIKADLEITTQLLQNQQSEQLRLSTEVSREQSRLAQLEGEFDQMQRQMRNLAATSGALCDSATQDQ